MLRSSPYNTVGHGSMLWRFTGLHIQRPDWYVLLVRNQEWLNVYACTCLEDRMHDGISASLEIHILAGFPSYCTTCITNTTRSQLQQINSYDVTHILDNTHQTAVLSKQVVMHQSASILCQVTHLTRLRKCGCSNSAHSPCGRSQQIYWTSIYTQHALQANGTSMLYWSDVKAW